MATLYIQIIDYLTSLPKIILGTWALSLVLLLATIGLIFYLNHIRQRLNVKERIQTVYLKKYQQDLVEYLYSGKEDIEIKK